MAALILKDLIHEMLVHGSYIFQVEGHHLIVVEPLVCDEVFSLSSKTI